MLAIGYMPLAAADAAAAARLGGAIKFDAIRSRRCHSVAANGMFDRCSESDERRRRGAGAQRQTRGAAPSRRNAAARRRREDDSDSCSAGNASCSRRLRRGGRRQRRQQRQPRRHRRRQARLCDSLSPQGAASVCPLSGTPVLSVGDRTPPEAVARRGHDKLDCRRVRRLLTPRARVVPRGGVLFALPVEVACPSHVGLVLSEFKTFYADACLREGKYSNHGFKMQGAQGEREARALGPPLQLFDFDFENDDVEVSRRARFGPFMAALPLPPSHRRRRRRRRLPSPPPPSARWTRAPRGSRQTTCDERIRSHLEMTATSTVRSTPSSSTSICRLFVANADMSDAARTT